MWKIFKHRKVFGSTGCCSSQIMQGIVGNNPLFWNVIPLFCASVCAQSYPLLPGVNPVVCDQECLHGS